MRRTAVTALTAVGLVAALALAACGSAAKPAAPGVLYGSTSAAAEPTFTVLGAGMVKKLIPEGLGPALEQSRHVHLKYVKGNSGALADKIKAGKLRGDLFVSAGAGVNQTLMGAANGNHVPWFLVFAGNAVVLAYDPHSRFAADFRSKPWYQVLQQPGVQVGRPDPNADPLGYYTLFVAHLAERFYHQPGLQQRLLGPPTNPAQVSDATFPGGNKDASFSYLSGVAGTTTPFVTLPDAVNLSKPEQAAGYADASYTNDKNLTLHGGPIQVTVAPLAGGDTKTALAAIELLVGPQGNQLLQRFHLLATPVLSGGDPAGIPASIRSSVRGAYQGG